MGDYLPLSLSLPINANARLRRPYWSSSLRAVCLVLIGLLLDPLSLSALLAKLLLGYYTMITQQYVGVIREISVQFHDAVDPMTNRINPPRI